MTLWGEGKADSGTKKKTKKSYPFKSSKGKQPEESRDDGCSDMEFSRGDSGENPDEVYDNDLRNAEIVYDSHDADPNVMRLLRYDDSPMAKGDDEVVIKVEASTVSIDDCRIRDGSYKWKFGQKPQFPICPGMDCFGTVLSCGKTALTSGVIPGDRVAALVMHGCNAKYRTVSYKDIVKAPEDLDACSAVCVIRTYAAAFQALMFGKAGHLRYSRKPLNGRKILIVGPCGTFERALVELSIFLGAKKVYFASTHPHDNYIRLLGAKPLSGDPEEWLETVEGKIDIAVDSVCEDRYEHSYAALKENGILVGTGMEEITKYGEDIISGIEKVWTHATVAMNNRCAYYYGIVNSWETDRPQCSKDVIYLFSLLAQDKIKPKIASRISLSKVPIAQNRLESNFVAVERRGVIVVEPWRLPEDEIVDDE